LSLAKGMTETSSGFMARSCSVSVLGSCGANQPLPRGVLRKGREMTKLSIPRVVWIMTVAWACVVSEGFAFDLIRAEEARRPDDP